MRLTEDHDTPRVEGSEKIKVLSTHLEVKHLTRTADGEFRLKDVTSQLRQSKADSSAILV